MSTEESREPLDTLLRELAQEDARPGTSREVQARLLSEVRSISRRRRRRVYTSATLLAVASVAGLLFLVPRSTRPPDSPPVEATTAEMRETTTDFLPLPGATAVPVDAHIVRLELPRAALAGFGLGQSEALIASRSPNTVLADLLVGNDGVARFVRFVHQE